MFMEFRNGAMMRKDKEKPGPSGMSRNHAFSLPSEWGGRNCLLTIDDLNTIKKMKEQLGGEELISFSTPEFSARARMVYDSLHITRLTQQNVWHVFSAMLPLLSPSD